MYTKLIEHEIGSTNPCLFGHCIPVGGTPIAKEPDDDDREMANLYEDFEKPQLSSLLSIS